MRVRNIMLFFGAVAVASATSVTSFSFDSTTINGHTYNLNASTGSNPDNSLISAYMTSILQQQTGCSTCTVTVTGAFVDTTYNADGNVTGNSGKSLTLGDTTGATTVNSNPTMSSTYDNFLANTSNTGATGNPISSQIMMTFTGITISNISFNYEIFPDLSCTAKDGVHCGGASNSNLPSMEFEAGKGTLNPVTTFGTNGTQYAVTPGSGNGTDKQSPLSATELAPQYINNWSGNLASANELDFVDWPATIGVDNIQLTWTTSPAPVPDPSSVLLLGTVMAGIGLRKRIWKRA